MIYHWYKQTLNDGPMFPNQIKDWKDGMVHNDINGKPWIWFQFAGFDENGNVMSQWLSLFTDNNISDTNRNATDN